VAFRFRTYGVSLQGPAADYLGALLAHPLLREWEAAALAETAIVEADEPRIIYRDKLARAGAASA
jgi:glutathione S-transferase